MTARVLECTDAEYRADPCARPSLSKSIAHILVTRSPLHAWHAHPKLGGAPPERSEAMEKGTLVHQLLLDPEQVARDFVVLDYDEYRTNEARGARDSVLRMGRTPIKRKEFEPIVEAVSWITNRLRSELGIELQGGAMQNEVAIEWEESFLHGQSVLCRCKIDRASLEGGQIVDVKTIREATPRQCSRSYVEHGYDIQECAYRRALEALDPELEGRVDFLFVYVETEPPYGVLAARPDGALREIGAVRWAQAVHLWDHCLREGRWPGYSTEAVMLHAPPWAVTEHLES